MHDISVKRKMGPWISLFCLVTYFKPGTAFGVATFSGSVTGKVVVSRDEGVKGRLEGLPVDPHELRLASGKCGETGEVLEKIVQFENNTVDIDSKLIGKDSINLLEDGKAELSLVVDACVPQEGLLNCDDGVRISCANIVRPGVTIEIIIIIIVAVVIFLLIVICIPIICCCYRNRKNKKQLKSQEDFDSIDDPFQTDCRSKSPMYDELSLPFIDASLPPTPKIGRTVNGFDILLGNSASSESIN